MEKYNYTYEMFKDQFEVVQEGGIIYKSNLIPSNKIRLKINKFLCEDKTIFEFINLDDPHDERKAYEHMCLLKDPTSKSGYPLQSEHYQMLSYAITTNQFTCCIEPINKIAKQIITFLEVNDINIKVIQLGVEVRKIIKVDCICPHCGGNGLIKPNKIVNYPKQQHGVDYK